MKLRRLQRYVQPDPGVPWSRLFVAILAVLLGYMAVKNAPQGVRYPPHAPDVSAESRSQNRSFQ
jgi:hypothetical protein